MPQELTVPQAATNPKRRKTMAIALGTKAPDFTLKTKRGEDLKDIKLSDNFGKKKTVLLFFPLAFTGVCTKELCEVSGGLSAYEKLDATVYALSVDSPFAQEAWADKEKISLILLSDLNKEVSKAYGTLLPDLIGLGSVSARAAFVIDKTGVIRYSEQTPTPLELPNFEKIKAALSSC
jgi:peroxiredoxin